MMFRISEDYPLVNSNELVEEYCTFSTRFYSSDSEELRERQQALERIVSEMFEYLPGYAQKNIALSLGFEEVKER